MALVEMNKTWNGHKNSLLTYLSWVKQNYCAPWTAKHSDDQVNLNNELRIFPVYRNNIFSQFNQNESSSITFVNTDDSSPNVVQFKCDQKTTLPYIWVTGTVTGTMTWPEPKNTWWNSPVQIESILVSKMCNDDDYTFIGFYILGDYEPVRTKEKTFIIISPTYDYSGCDVVAEETIKHNLIHYAVTIYDLDCTLLSWTWNLFALKNKNLSTLEKNDLSLSQIQKIHSVCLTIFAERGIIELIRSYLCFIL
jgi:hypothetical protein